MNWFGDFFLNENIFISISKPFLINWEDIRINFYSGRT